MRKLKTALLIVLLIPAICFSGNAELYNMINGNTYGLSAGGTDYSLNFSGNDAETFSGAAYLTWPETVLIDGYRYQIRKKMLLPFMVWDGTVGLDVADNQGNVTVFDFILDYEGALIQVCPDLRFFPESAE